jgi:hypothetical protein
MAAQTGEGDPRFPGARIPHVGGAEFWPEDAAATDTDSGLGEAIDTDSGLGELRTAVMTLSAQLAEMRALSEQTWPSRRSLAQGQRAGRA